MYNFSFTTDVAPVIGSIELGIFKPGGPDSFSVSTFVPNSDPVDPCDLPLGNCPEDVDGNNVVNVSGGWTDSERKQYFDAKNNALLPLIGSSTAAGIVWLWNIRHIKKSVSSKYSDSDPISIGINSQGQLEARISF